MMKMKVRLLATDSKIPNLAIMKIYSYHKAIGDDVDWYNPLFDMFDTDILYHSKIFTFSPQYQYYPLNSKIIKGGTGFDIKSKLPDEIEDIIDLDYSLYPDCDYSIQFLSRGCIRNCSFCLVRQKEGIIHQVKPLIINKKGKYIMLLDNNFFACKQWRENIEILKSYNQPIDFNQGIDLRILTEEMASELSKLKIKVIHCAWDNYKDKDIVLKGLNTLTKYIKPYKITCYVLVGFKHDHIVDEDLERVMTLKEMGINPFAMGYIDFNNKNCNKPKEIKDFCRWVNMKACFKSCTWDEYTRRNQHAKRQIR